MARKKRVRKNTQRNMHKRLITGKKPLSTEQKELRKKAREEDRKRTKAVLEKTKKNRV